jgi:multidrug efflux pump subunit AcrB
VIAIGVLVDNSILVIEAISRRREEHPEQPINELVTAATADIGPAVVASTLAFLALFVPFLLVPGWSACCSGNSFWSSPASC